MQRIKNLIFENQLIGGSLVMIVGSTFVNFANYIYHLLLGRMLGPVNYGTLNSLIAIFYLLFIPSMALITVITKFTSVYKARNDYSKLYSLFRFFSERILILGAGVLLLFILARNSIAGFLNITETSAIILVGSFFVLSLLSTINNGILQGLLNFNFLSANNVFSSLLKVGFGVLLVSMGLSVNGAILAVLIAYILPYFASLYPLRFLWQHKPRKLNIDYKEIFTYAGPATVVVLGMTSLYSTDILLVKHFFPPFEAGVYAALAVVGKIIFFASSTISIVMFPIISEKFEKGSKYQTVLYQAFALVTASSILLTIIYFLLPELMLKLLYGSSYRVGAPYLGLFAVFISIYSLSNLLIQFFLSIRETKIYFLTLTAALFQGILIWFFHENLYQVIYSSIIVTSLLLFSLLVYCFVSIREAYRPVKNEKN